MKNISFIKKVTFILIIFFVLLILFLKVNSANTFSHIDSWANYPLSYVIENNLNWNENAQYPGMGQRLFYYFIVNIKLITGINYFYITKYFFIIIDFFLILFIYLFFKKILPKNRINIFFLCIFILFINSYVFRRFIVTLRENYALIMLMGYIYMIYSFNFTKKKVSSIFSGAIFISHPIASIIFLMYNLFLLIILTIKKEWDNIKQLFLVGLGTFIVGINGFIGYIKSLFWQYNNALTEVVIKNDNDFSYFMIDFKKINYVFFILISIAFIFILKNLKIIKNNNSLNYLIYPLFLLLSLLYIIGLIPSSGLYQDRIILYLGVFGILFIGYTLSKLSIVKNSFVFMVLITYFIITFTKLIDFGIWVPFENTNFNNYGIVNNAKNAIIYGFDRNVLYQINPMIKIDDELSDTFFNLQNDIEIEKFLVDNKFILFISDFTFNQRLINNYTANYLKTNNKLTLLDDKNYIYYNY
ncbi:MAG: hypothetical protein Q8K30_03285 [Candidatus Gracilibacteria bacterium]|nr:hypothetical protein [Candidatus Gracilibacteria bacterium]